MPYNQLVNRIYFLISLGLLMLVIAGAVDFGQHFLSAYDDAGSSKLQADLLALRLIEAQQPKIKGTKITPEISLLFVGDIMLSRGVANQISRNNNPDYPFLRIAPTIQSADLAFGNLEGPISNGGKNQGSQYSFRADESAVEGLEFAGFDILNLANNHIWDWGEEALIDTVDILQKHGINWVGAGRNENEANSSLVVATGDTHLAFLGYTNLYPKNLEAGDKNAGVSSFSVLNIKEKIKELKNSGNTDLVIISLHWGEEYQNNASESQKRIAHELIDAGADLIVGHHPHVVQNIENYNGKWIFYSLGNFVFDQSFSEETSKGLMLKATIQDKKIIKIEPIEIRINPTFQPELIGL